MGMENDYFMRVSGIIIHNVMGVIGLRMVCYGDEGKEVWR